LGMVSVFMVVKMPVLMGVHMMVGMGMSLPFCMYMSRT